jgi:hypothetical protein
MQRGFKRVRYRVAVLPTMAACPAPEASRAAKPARSAPEEAPKSRGRTSRSSTSDGFSPAKARATDKLATAPLPKGDVQRALQQEHDKAEQLARELAAAWRGLRSQATAMADNAAHDQQLSDLRQGLQQAEASAAAHREMLAQERARKQDLQQQFAVRGEASPDRGSNAAASLSETPTLPPTTDKQLAVFPANDRPMLPAKNTPATVATRPAPAEAFGDPELARLISRASLLHARRRRQGTGTLRQGIGRRRTGGEGSIERVALGGTWSSPAGRGVQTALKPAGKRRGVTHR